MKRSHHATQPERNQPSRLTERQRGLSRRRFVSALAASALTLPLLSLAERRAQADPAQQPMRLVIFFHECGTLTDEWHPSGSGENFDLTAGMDPATALLGPLLPYRDKLNVISGLGNGAADLTNGHSGHGRSKIALLTGEAAYGAPDSTNWANGASVDQVIAERLGPVTKKRSIDAVLGPDEVWPETIISFSGPNSPITSRINDPVALHNDLFAGFGQPQDPAAEQLLARRLRVLAAADRNFKDYAGRLTGNDTKRLDEHAAYLRELAERLQAGNHPSLGCNPPSPPSAIDFLWELDMAGRQLLDQIAMALACDISRVATFNLSSTEHPQFPWTGVTVPNSEFHNFMHIPVETQSAADRATKRAILRWHMEQLAHLLGAMDAIQEGDGSLLDHSLVLSISDHGDAAGHFWWDLPVILAGGACGRLKTGRHLNFAGRSNNDLLVSILNLFGYDDTSFGRAEYNNGALPL